MITGLLQKRLPLILGCVALVTLLLALWWAYGRGKADCRADMARANEKAITEAANANREALGKELQAASERAANRQNALNSVEGTHAKDDDDPAAAIVQRAFDGLRGTGGR